MMYEALYHDMMEGIELHEHREGLLTVWSVPFDLVVKSKGGREEVVRQRFLVVYPNGREVWTTDVELLASKMVSQYSIF